MKRVICVRFPAWPLQRLLSKKPELKNRPVVLFAQASRGGLKVVCSSSEAMKAGVKPGQPLAEAKSLLAKTKPHFERHDADADRLALEELALWCERFSPFVGVDESEAADCLLMESSGVAPLFGGEESLVQTIKAAFTEEGYFTRIAMADTLGAAWAVAHFGTTSKGQPVIVSSRDLSKTLSSLPIDSLRLPRTVVETLSTLDLRRVGQVLKLPRESLPSRFGLELLNRLDQACGQIEELCTIHRPQEPIAVEWDFDPPTTDRRVLEAAGRVLLERLLTKFTLRNAGILRFWCGLKFVPSRVYPVNEVGEGEAPAEPLCATGSASANAGSMFSSNTGRASGTRPSTLTCPGTARRVVHPNPHPPGERGQSHANGFSVELVSPSTSFKHLAHLLDLRWERITLPGEVLRMRLEIAQTALVRYRQRELFEEETHQDRERQREFASLVNRLSSRLGSEAVLRPVLVADHQPEHAVRLVPIVRQEPGKKTSKKSPGGKRPAKTPLPVLPSPFPLSRPVQLFPEPLAIEVMSVVPDGPPIRFSWKGHPYTIVRWWGPERIETGWWRSRDIRRDYYRVETGEGSRFWLFRDLKPEGTWFLHGIFE